MPLTALWSLIIALIMLAIGLSLKLANISHLLKLADKELDSLIKQIASLKEEHEKAISGLSQLHRAEVKKVLTAYEKAMDKLIEQTEHYRYSQNTLYGLAHLGQPKTLADLSRSVNTRNKS